MSRKYTETDKIISIAPNLITRQFEEIMDREEDPDYKKKIAIKKNKDNYGKDFI